MTTLKHIVQDDYKFFANFDSKDKNEMIDVCKYIEFLASQSSTSLESWDIVKIFRAPKAQKRLITDKAEINKRFFKHKEEANVKPKEEIKPDEKDKPEDKPKEEKKKEPRETTIEEDLDRLMSKRDNIQIRLKQTVDKWLSQLRRNHESSKRSVKEYYDRYITEMQKLVENDRTLQCAIESDDTERMFNEFKEASSLGFWKFYRLYRNKITFTTAYDVVIQHKNPSANLNIQVNMGQYLCSIDLSTFEILVKPFRNNLEDNGYYHPYVSSSGIPCFGNSSDTMHNLVSQRKISDLLNLLASLLSTYEDSGPHRALIHFHKKDKSMNRVTTITLEEEIKKKEESDGLRPITITENVTQEDLQNIMEQDPSGGQLFNAIGSSLEAMTDSA